jgi:hypothetical protein
MREINKKINKKTYIYIYVYLCTITKPMKQAAQHHHETKSVILEITNNKNLYI